MRFSPPLTEGRLLRRYKRFLADVEFGDGRFETAHIANPGAMLGMAQPGSRVFLSRSSNPKRLLPWSVEIMEADGVLVGVNAANPNRLVAEALAAKTLPETATYDTVRGEVKYGTRSRVDFLLSASVQPDAYLEVKNAHFSRTKGVAEFPDSVTERGAKHLRELRAVVAAGHRGIMLYLVQRDDITSVAISRDIDPEYGEAFDEARAGGVEMLAYRCRLSPVEIAVTDAIPVLG